MLSVHWQVTRSSFHCIRRKQFTTRWLPPTGSICLSVCYDRQERDMQCVLAVDGGNTKTIALVAALDGTILVQNEAVGVLHAGSSDNTGVSVVCGTGAVTGARAPDGRTWHSSMWQDQVQGGAQLGQKTLNAVYRAELGIELPTTLTQRVL